MCVGVCPHNVLELDDKSYPVLRGNCTSCGFCSGCCPGAEVDYPALSRQVFNGDYDRQSLEGHVENLYIAHPENREIRYAGASGGVVTGLLDYLLAHNKIDGAVVVGMDSLIPYKTRGLLATTREEIQACAQSKYCVTPSMAVLQEVRRRKGRFAIVALPCQVHALRKLETVDPSLAKKISYIFGLYCHCTLDVSGHEEAIQAFGIPLEDVASFQFRGGGWPGGFFVVRKDGSEVRLHDEILIKDVMNVMFRLYGPERCKLCIDALCEYADLSFGDFWAFDFSADLAQHERCTLISQRTRVGKELMEEIQGSGEFTVHALPHARNSKRILRMAEGKKTRSFVGLLQRRKRNRPYPFYNIEIPRQNGKARRSVFLYALFTKIQARLFRTIVLKLLFSPVGVLAYRLNTLRKNIVNDYRA
jgi:coenzyme F420 hydrogenase subunit beta